MVWVYLGTPGYGGTDTCEGTHAWSWVCLCIPRFGHTGDEYPEQVEQAVQALPAIQMVWVQIGAGYIWARLGTVIPVASCGKSKAAAPRCCGAAGAESPSRLWFVTLCPKIFVVPSQILRSWDQSPSELGSNSVFSTATGIFSCSKLGHGHSH